MTSEPFVRLGVYMSEQEKLDAADATRRAATTPVISIGSGPDMASVAWHHAKERIHKIALAHGLPEFEGYYGADLQTGEFLATPRSEGEVKTTRRALADFDGMQVETIEPETIEDDHLLDGDAWEHFSFEFGDGYELCFEPQLYGQILVALYHHRSLVGEKIPVLPLLDAGETLRTCQAKTQPPCGLIAHMQVTASPPGLMSKITLDLCVIHAEGVRKLRQLGYSVVLEPIEG